MQASAPNQSRLPTAHDSFCLSLVPCCALQLLFLLPPTALLPDRKSSNWRRSSTVGQTRSRWLDVRPKCLMRNALLLRLRDTCSRASRLSSSRQQRHDEPHLLLASIATRISPMPSTRRDGGCATASMATHPETTQLPSRTAGGHTHVPRFGQRPTNCLTARGSIADPPIPSSQCRPRGVRGAHDDEHGDKLTESHILSTTGCHWYQLDGHAYQPSIVVARGEPASQPCGSCADGRRGRS